MKAQELKAKIISKIRENAEVLKDLASDRESVKVSNATMDSILLRSNIYTQMAKVINTDAIMELVKLSYISRQTKEYKSWLEEVRYLIDDEHDLRPFVNNLAKQIVSLIGEPLGKIQEMQITDLGELLDQENNNYSVEDLDQMGLNQVLTHTKKLLDNWEVYAFKNKNTEDILRSTKLTIETLGLIMSSVASSKEDLENMLQWLVARSANLLNKFADIVETPSTVIRTTKAYTENLKQSLYKDI